jgi:hypothetical protein
MKYFTYLALIGVTWAVRQAKNETNMVHNHLSVDQMSTDDLQKLVDDAVSNSKLGESQQGGKNIVNADELKSVEKVLADRIYSRVIDSGYHRPQYGSMYYRPQYAPYLGGYGGYMNDGLSS